MQCVINQSMDVSLSSRCLSLSAFNPFELISSPKSAEIVCVLLCVLRLPEASEILSLRSSSRTPPQTQHRNIPVAFLCVVSCLFVSDFGIDSVCSVFRALWCFCLSSSMISRNFFSSIVIASLILNSVCKVDAGVLEIC